MDTNTVIPDFVFKTVAENHAYPVLDIPPAAQAQVRRGFSDIGESVYSLDYGGRDIVKIVIKGDANTKIRMYSDSNMQSQPFIQQFYVSAEKPVNAVVILHMRKDALCMRPYRAQSGQAILAQAGGPLINGANGFYGVWEDLMLEWYEAEWQWLGNRVTRHEDGSTSAAFKIHLDNRPFLMLMRQRYYGQHLGYRYFKPWEWRPNSMAISGWCSWEAYHKDITEKNVEEAAKLMAALVPYGLEYIQLDDGYEQELIPPEKHGKVFESWLVPNDKFPGGHKKIVESIRSQGLIPAIWTNAIITNEEAANTGLCMMENGKAFKGDWIQFILNCTEDVLEEHVLPYYRGLKEFGYKYFKTDAIRHLYFDGLQECVRRGLMTDEQANERFRSFLECARKGIGEDAYLLSCWGILSQAVGLADACRIATDANPSWGRIQMQIAEAARCFFAQRILFTIDSDHICARTELEWARMLLSFISVTGGVYMLSDPLECYDEPRLQIIKRTLPSLEVYTAETGPVNYTTPAFCWLANKRMTPEEESNGYFENGNNRFGTLWSTHFCKGDRDWAVVIRNALIPLEEEAIALEALGLSAGCRYAVYDFWEDEFLGIADESVKLRELQIGHVQVCALTPVSDISPVLIASDRHVSMDAVSVTGYKSEKGLLRLRLHGIKGESFTYCIYSEHPCSIEADCRFSVKTEGKLYRVTVAFEDEGAVVIARYV